ncbi:MAG TPA: hypothetical protein DD377_01160 [Firmicutes bacterium]|nr:hypothetical protein [Bacillota bacterium]
MIAGSALTPFIKFFVKEIPNVPYVSAVYLLLVFQTGSLYFFSYKINFLNATQQNYIFRKVQIISNLIKAVLQIVSILAFKNYFIFLGIAIFFSLATDIFCSIYVNIKYPFLRGKANKLESEELKKLKRNVFALFLYKVSNTVSTTVDTILISKMLGVIPAAIYSNYYLIMNYVDSFYNNVLGALTPSIGNLMVDSKLEKKRKFFKTLQSAYYWISIYIAVGMIVCFNPFISTFFGSQYLLDQSVVIALTVSVTLTNFQRPCSLMRDANGLFWYGKFRPLIMAVINLGATIFLTHFFGIIGVVLGTIISKILTFVWYDPFIVFKYVLKDGLKEYFYNYIEKWAILLLYSTACIGICNKIELSGMPQIFVYAFVVTIFVNLGNYYINYGKAELLDMKNYLFDLLKKLKKRKKTSKTN